MALERQIVTIPLAQGLDTKTDAKQVGGGKLLALQNGVFTTGKKLRKRYGTTPRTMTTAPGVNISGLNGLYTLGDEILLQTDGGNSVGTLYGYSGEADQAWSYRGRFTRTEVSQGPLARNANLPQESSVAVHSSGLGCAVYPSLAPGGATYNLTAMLFETATLRPVKYIPVVTTAASQYSGKVVRVGDFFLVAYGSASEVKLRVIQVSTLTDVGGYAQTFVTGGAGVSRFGFDLLTNAAGTAAYVAYPISTWLDVAVRSFNPGTVTWSAATNLGMALGVDKVQQVSLAEDPGTSGNIMVSTVTEAPLVYVSAVTTALAVVVAKTAVTVLPGSIDAIGASYCTNGGMRLYVSISTSALGIGGVSFVQVASIAATTYTPSAASMSFLNYQMVSVPVAIGAYNYVALAAYRGGTTRYLAKDFGSWSASAPTMVAKFGASVESSGFKLYPPRPGSAYKVVPRICILPAGGYLTTYGTSIDVSGIASNVGVNAVTITFPTTPAVAAEQSGGLYFSGGLPLMHDGNTVFEVGYYYDPTMVASSSGVGGTIAAGTYGYCCIYEWVDATGAVHRSPVSPVSSVVLAGATSSVTIYVANYTNTYRNAPDAASGLASFPRAVIYRTIAGGSTYYRLGSVNCDATSLALTFTDSGIIADLTLQGLQLLYTTGGVLDSVAPPALSALTIYRNRVVGIDAENPNRIWYSKQVVPGDTAEFSDFLTLNMDTTGGENTALATLDDKLLVFKPGVVYYLTGTGPDSTGGQNDLSVPILINTNSGCIEPRSVITAADGCLYQSAKGIFILDRSLNDSYIGADVEAYNAAGIRNAVIVPTTNEVRFVLSTGTVLVYDFLYKQWSTSTGLSASAACVLNGVVHTGTAAGVVSYENPAVFTDNGTAIELRFTTGWLGAGDLQSFLRIYKLMLVGTWKSSHTLNVWVQYDYRTDTAAANKYAIAATADPSPGQFQYRVNLSQQKAQAVSITVYDSSITGESLDLSALTFEVGRKAGPMKLPAAGNV